MRGTVAGGDAVATLRCQQASRLEDRICYAARSSLTSRTR
jgi:hypothetical protein